MRLQKTVTIGDVQFGSDKPISFILGPCQLESRDHALYMAERIADVCLHSNVKFVFKSSFDKANRSSASSSRGVGIDRGLSILAEIRTLFNCPIITDVHDVFQCSQAAEVVDALQIPAFLSRQTDLLLAAGRSGLPVNIKKGQFLSPVEMGNVADKVASTGNENILLCERGTFFGYNNLVNDFRGLEVMRDLGYPVIFDATHSVQQPGGLGTSSGGERKYVSLLARAACAAGIAGLFIETHDDPDNAPCDGPNMIQIDNLSALLKICCAFDRLAKSATLI